MLNKGIKTLLVIILFDVCIALFTGAQLGTIISFPLSALLCHFVGWHVAFYAIGNELPLSLFLSVFYK